MFSLFVFPFRLQLVPVTSTVHFHIYRTSNLYWYLYWKNSLTNLVPVPVPSTILVLVPVRYFERERSWNMLVQRTTYEVPVEAEQIQYSTVRRPYYQVPVLVLVLVHTGTSTSTTDQVTYHGLECVRQSNE